MNQYYRNSCKKSILCLFAFIFTLFLPFEVYGIVPSDAGFIQQKSTWDQIFAQTAWEISTGTKEIVVAVIDTSIDIRHPDLSDNIWINKKEIAGNGIDDDNNGYIDDIYGWNFVDDNSSPFNYESDNLDYADNYSVYTHGTIVAGLIGAVAENGNAGTGINWNVSLMPLKAFDVFGSGTYLDIERAVDYAVNNGADIINISFVGDLNELSLKNKLKQAYENGVLTVVAAGNNNINGSGDMDVEPMYPACFDKMEENWILGVTSVGASDKLSYFANYGSCVDITAPGELIYSTIIKSKNGNNQYFGGPWYGTSFSTPLITGAVALIKSINPQLTPSQIIFILLSTADDIEAVNPDVVGRIGYGRLNLYKALDKALSGKNLYSLPERICRIIGGRRVVCNEPDKFRDLVMANLNEQIIALDVVDKEKIAILLSEKVKIIFGDGGYEKNISLNKSYSYKKINFVELEGRQALAVFGSRGIYEYIIYFFDLAGNKISEVAFFENTPFSLSMIENNSFALIKNEGHRITVSHFNFAGKLISKKFGPLAVLSDEVVSGRFWGEGNQIAFLVNQNENPSLCVFDLDTGSFYVDKITVLSISNKTILLRTKPGSDINKPGIMNYDPESGKYQVFDGKGNILGQGCLSF